MNIALMIIDMQKGFYRDNAALSMDRASEYINAAVDVFNTYGLPVIWVKDQDDYRPGEAEFELIDSLSPGPNDHVIHKAYSNAFNKTNCHEILSKEKVDTVLIAGYCAEYCVLSSYRGALDLDLTPILLKGALASGKDENIRFVEDISDIMTYGAMKKMLKNMYDIKKFRHDHGVVGHHA